MLTFSKKFLAAVIAPTAVIGLYFTLIATPVYRSTSTIMISNPAKASGGVSAMLTGGTGDSLTGAFIAKEFISSWQEYKAIDNNDGVMTLWGQGDIISSYIRLLSNDTTKYHFYQDHVETALDKKSGILTLNTYAFSAKDARALNATLLSDTETQVNQINLQKDQDLARTAQAQLEKAQQAVADDNAAIAAFRKQTGFYKPDLDYQAALVAQSAISSSLSSAKADFNGVNGSTPNNPAIDGMKDKIASYKQDTDKLARKSAGINAVAKQYDALEAKRQLDLAMLQKAGQLVQDTSIKAAADHYYVQIISTPSEPGDAEFPNALFNTFLAFCVLLVVYKFIIK